MPIYTRPLVAYPLLILLCLALYLPGLAALPVIDRDEARFAQASKQMLQSGDFVNIRFQDQPRHKKPIAIYWAQAAAAALSGAREAIWAYRIPSLIGAILGVLLTFFFGSRLFDRKTALLAAAAFASCLLLVFESHFASTDAALMAATTLAQGALGLIYLAHRRGQASTGWGPAAAFWIAQGIGILIKGPVTPLVSLCTVIWLVIADRSWRWLKGLKPGWGILIALAIASPWMISITMATQGSFFVTAVQEDLLPKLIGGHEGHGFPPGYYLLLMSVTFWPASLYVWQGLFRAWRWQWMDGIRYSLAWLVPAWVVFEIIPTKLPHYILTMYPPLALITAAAVFRAQAEEKMPPRDRWGWVLPLGWGLIWAVLSLGLLGLAIYLEAFTWWAVIPVATTVVVLGLGYRLLKRGRLAAVMVVGCLGSAVFLGSVFQGVLPGLTPVWLSESAQALVLSHSQGEEPPVVAATGYHEPSLVFRLGTATRLTDPPGAAEHLKADPGGMALVGDQEEAAFKEELAKRGVAAQALGSVRGFNYTKGRWRTLTLYRGVSH